MNINQVLTVIGEDRPGLVEMLARAVSEQGGNWLESRMSHLGGKFAGILRVSVPEEKASTLLAALRGLDEEGLRVVAELSDEVEADGRQPVQLELVGADRVGIVRDVTAVLTELQVYVEEFTTECKPAPMSGQMLFTATAQLRLPSGISEDDLRERLEQLAQDLVVDITLG